MREIIKEEMGEIIKEEMRDMMIEDIKKIIGDIRQILKVEIDNIKNKIIKNEREK